MKSTVVKRIARLGSLLALALVALAVLAQTTLASLVEGTGAPAGPATVTPAAGPSISTMSTAGWIVLAAVAAALLIIAEWALLRGVQRRRAQATSESPSAETFCTQKPSSALCRA
jgi:hypothetical protein